MAAFPRDWGSSCCAMVAQQTASSTVAERCEELILQFGMLAPFVFLFLSLFRPFVLVPLTVFSLAAGLAFGSVLGTIYALAGATAGATGSFLLASTFRSNKQETESSNRKLKAVTSRIQEHGFLYILLLRIAPIHFDFVSYAAAASRANYRAFAAATFRVNTWYCGIKCPWIKLCKRKLCRLSDCLFDLFDLYLSATDFKKKDA